MWLEEGSDFLQLETWVIANCLAWVLGIKPGSSARSASSPNRGASLQPGWEGFKTGRVTETRVGKSGKAGCRGGERQAVYAESKVGDGVDLGNRLLPAQQKSRRNDGLPEIQNQDWRTWEVKGLRQPKNNKTPESRGSIWMRKKISKGLESEDYKHSVSIGTSASRWNQTRLLHGSPGVSSVHDKQQAGLKNTSENQEGIPN